MRQPIPITIGGDWFSWIGPIIFVALLVATAGFISIKMRESEQRWVKEQIRQAIEERK